MTEVYRLGLILPQTSLLDKDLALGELQQPLDSYGFTTEVLPPRPKIQCQRAMKHLDGVVVGSMRAGNYLQDWDALDRDDGLVAAWDAAVMTYIRAAAGRKPVFSKLDCFTRNGEEPRVGLYDSANAAITRIVPKSEATHANQGGVLLDDTEIVPYKDPEDILEYLGAQATHH